MWWEDKLVRTLRCRLRQKPGVLGGLLTILGSQNAYVGEIKTIHMGMNFMVRDITILPTMRLISKDSQSCSGLSGR